MDTNQRAAIIADPFTRHYVGTMLQDLENQERDAAAEEGRDPVDVGSIHTLRAETLQECATDCAAFQLAAAALLADSLRGRGYTAEQAGSDFWLTRVGHGAGYWDRGLGRNGDLLTAMCGHGTDWGSVEPTLGDDGEVYLC